jgi:hypothetical protein
VVFASRQKSKQGQPQGVGFAYHPLAVKVTGNQRLEVQERHGCKVQRGRTDDFIPQLLHRTVENR